jgi:glycerol-3-phosphate dehydrogenase
MSKFNVLGNSMFDEFSSQLGFHFRRNGSLVLAFNEQERKTLNELLERGKINRVPGLELLTGKQVLSIEPIMNKGLVAALRASTGGIVCPYEMTIALSENAAHNGVAFKLSSEVISIDIENRETGTIPNTISNTIFKITIKQDKEPVYTRFIVNAAGVNADKVAEIAGAGDFIIKPRKGEYCVLDKREGNLLSHTLFNVPGKYGKGILVTPTVDGNILIGPNANDTQHKDDTSVTNDGLKAIITSALKTVPGLPAKAVIKSFAGVRAISGDDFIIEESKHVRHFVNVAGICSPGITAAPAIAKHVVGILGESGLNLKPDGNFQPIRRPIQRFSEMDNATRKRLISENPTYGNIVCRCEIVSEAEIVESIRRPCGATDVNGVKRRVRPGMGRCQGGFCMPRVMEILSRELGIPLKDITKSGGESYILTGKIR